MSPRFKVFVTTAVLLLGTTIAVGALLGWLVGPTLSLSFLVALAVSASLLGAAIVSAAVRRFSVPSEKLKHLLEEIAEGNEQVKW